MIDYFDLHCDTLTEILPEESLSENHANLDLTRASKNLKRYGQVFALWYDYKKIDINHIDENFIKIFHRAMQLLEKCKDSIVLCKTSESMEKAFQEGKQAAVLAIEDLSIMGSYAERAAEYGIRLAAIVWNYESVYGYGAAADEKGHLKKEGITLIRKLDSDGVILDVSHLSEAGFYDLCEAVSSPFAASHSNSRKICPHERNLTDGQLREIIFRRGICGLNLYREFVSGDSQCSLKDIIIHIEHILSLGGGEILAMGCDFDGCRNCFPKGITGIESIGTIYEELLKLNYKEEIIRNIFFNNAYRFFKRNL